MIGHTDDETAVDGLLQPRLVDTTVPSKNPRLASWMFLLVPCLLVVGWYGSMPSATSSAATKLLAVAAGHTAWPKVAYGVSLGGCTLPHVEFTQTLGVLPPHAGLTRASASFVTAGLVMEINPSTKGKDAPLDLRPQWMYDQVEAKSELDFVLDLRREHGHRHRPPLRPSAQAPHATPNQPSSSLRAPSRRRLRHPDNEEPLGGLLHRAHARRRQGAQPQPRPQPQPLP